MASWHWLFGREGALVCILAIWTSGPPVIMHQETLDLWNKNLLKVEPFRFYTAWSKYCCLLNMVLGNLLVKKRLPESGEASVSLWLPKQFQYKPKNKHGKEAPPGTKFDRDREASDKLLPDHRLFRFWMEMDSAGGFGPQNRRYGCEHGSVPPAWAANAFLEEERRRIDFPRWYHWKERVASPEGEARTINEDLMKRRKQRITKSILDMTRALLELSRPGEADLDILEMQDTLGRVLDSVPQCFRDLFDIRCGTEGTEGTSVSDQELIRKNLSERERSVGILERSRFFPENILNDEQRAKAKALLVLNNFSGEDFWPAPGNERPRLAPFWR